jgi:anti-sigma B factor antagonist
MSVSAQWSGDRCRLGIDDDLTIYTAAALKQALLDPLGRADEVEVELSRVAECDTAGFQLLVLLKREAEAEGKRLSLTGHSPAVLKVFDLYNMAGYFGDPLVIPSA